MSQRQVQINAELARCALASDVLEIVRRSVEEFNVVNCGTALSRIARPPDGRRLVAREGSDPTLASLLAAAAGLVRQHALAQHGESIAVDRAGDSIERRGLEHAGGPLCRRDLYHGTGTHAPSGKKARPGVRSGTARRPHLRGSSAPAHHQLHRRPPPRAARYAIRWPPSFHRL